MTRIARRESAPDPTVYPVEEQVPESNLAMDVRFLLLALVRRWVAERGEPALVGSDQFIYYRQYDPRARVAPDVYVLPGVAPETFIGAWKTWETGIVPSIAIEVVGLDVRKDYDESPLRYEEMGVPELVIFDPLHDEGRDRILFQLYRRKRGKLVQIEVTRRDRVRSKVLGCWLRSVGDGTGRRLRLATGPRGDVLFPTAEEAAAAEIARLRTELDRRR
jgi:Uma2 family endonuclease